MPRGVTKAEGPVFKIQAVQVFGGEKAVIVTALHSSFWMNSQSTQRHARFFRTTLRLRGVATVSVPNKPLPANRTVMLIYRTRRSAALSRRRKGFTLQRLSSFICALHARMPTPFKSSPVEKTLCRYFEKKTPKIASLRQTPKR